MMKPKRGFGGRNPQAGLQCAHQRVDLVGAMHWACHTTADPGRADTELPGLCVLVAVAIGPDDRYH